MPSNKVKVILLILLVACSTIFFIPDVKLLRIPVAFLNIFYLPGLVFLLITLDEKLKSPDLVILPLVVSPIVLTLILLALFKITGSHLLSVELSFSLIYIAAFLYLLLRKTQTSEEPEIPNTLLLISAGFAFIIALLYIVNPFLTVRSDSWYHASVVNEILDRGIPPMEPRFPDIKIRYMWIYHLFISTWKMISGIGVFAALATLNVVSALSLPYLAGRLTSLFKPGKKYILLTPVFVVAGLESVSWVLIPLNFARALTGEVKGMAEISRMVREINLNSSEVIQFLHPYWSWMVNLIDKFITITAFSYSLDLFVLCFIVFVVGWKDRRIDLRKAILLTLLISGTLLFHVITGSALTLTIIGASILSTLIYRFIFKEELNRFVSITAPIAAILAGAFCFSYINSLTGGNVSSDGSIFSMLHIGIRNILTILFPLVVLYCPARIALRKLLKTNWKDYEPFAIWIIALIFLNILVNLPTRNESKLIFPLFLILSPPIIWEAIDKIRGPAGIKKSTLIAWTILIFFVPPILTVRGFLIDKPVKEFEKARYLVSDEQKMVFNWIKNNTEIDAVIMEDNINCLMPVFAHRRNFYPPPSAITVTGYRGEKVSMYREIKDNIFSQEPIKDETINKLKSVKNDVYIIVWSSDIKRKPYLKEKLYRVSNHFNLVFKSKEASIYRFVGYRP